MPKNFVAVGLAIDDFELNKILVILIGLCVITFGNHRLESGKLLLWKLPGFQLFSGKIPNEINSRQHCIEIIWPKSLDCTRFEVALMPRQIANVEPGDFSKNMDGNCLDHQILPDFLTQMRVKIEIVINVSCYI
jgi:hypothetical protein